MVDGERMKADGYIMFSVTSVKLRFGLSALRDGDFISSHLIPVQYHDDSWHYGYSASNFFITFCFMIFPTSTQLHAYIYIEVQRLRP